MRLKPSTSANRRDWRGVDTLCIPGLIVGCRASFRTSPVGSRRRNDPVVVAIRPSAAEAGTGTRRADRPQQFRGQHKDGAGWDPRGWLLIEQSVLAVGDR
jgi:hypothetical protein